MQFNMTSRAPRTLTELPNISFVMAERLAQIGVTTPERLRQLGAEQVWRCLCAAGMRCDAHVLLALEGAIAGLPPQEIAAERRVRLLRQALAR